MSSTVNREYKDRLFKFIFGNPEKKNWTLSLYNAINGSSYPDSDAEKIQIRTLNDVVYMSMKNDISFLIGNTMNFYEVQSSFNPNMPIRLLIYAGMVYGNYVKEPENLINIYSSKQQKLPVPKLVCFYDGSQRAEDKTVLSLSKSFADNVQADIEVNVTMLNINYGRNSELMEKCLQLSEYAMFVAEVRKNLKEEHDKGNSREETLSNAVSKAIEALPEESEIRKFLEKNRAEVTGMCLKEYDEKRTMELFEKEWKEEGRQEGLEEGEKKGLQKGEKKFSSLMAKLLSMGKMDDIRRVVEDEEYREKLYMEYGITGSVEKTS
jgi:hypothetical protein